MGLDLVPSFDVVLGWGIGQPSQNMVMSHFLFISCTDYELTPVAAVRR
jgi:hypothetical protein